MPRPALRGPSAPPALDDRLPALLRPRAGGAATLRLLAAARAAFCDGDWARAGRLSGEAMDFCWDRLHEGHWESVPSAWRAAYMAACLLHAHSELGPGERRLPQLKAVLRALDLGLVLGGDAVGCEPLHELAEEIHEFCVTDLAAFPSPAPARRCFAGPPGLAVAPAAAVAPDGTGDPPDPPEDAALLLESTAAFLAQLPSYAAVCGTGTGRAAEDAARLSPFCPYNGRDSFVPRVLQSHGSAIPRIHCPSLAEFRDQFFTPCGPVVITGVVDQWPAFTHWADWGYLKRLAGLRTVPVELGRSYMARDFGLEMLSLGEFIDRSILQPEGDSTKPMAYLAQHQLLDQVRPLARDVVQPEYCSLGDPTEPVIANVWLGPAHTVSNLHTDKYHNCFAQVVGRKYFRLYDPRHTASLYPIPSGLHTNTSQVDVDHPDHAAFPHFRTAPYVECELHAGELLFLPQFWWHYVRATAPSLGISFWFRRSVENRGAALPAASGPPTPAPGSALPAQPATPVDRAGQAQDPAPTPGPAASSAHGGEALEGANSPVTNTDLNV